MPLKTISEFFGTAQEQRSLHIPYFPVSSAAFSHTIYCFRLLVLNIHYTYNSGSPKTAALALLAPPHFPSLADSFLFLFPSCHNCSKCLCHPPAEMLPSAVCSHIALSGLVLLETMSVLITGNMLKNPGTWWVDSLLPTSIGRHHYSPSSQMALLASPCWLKLSFS